MKRELPMHVTSSLVSEVLPLVAFLNSTMKFKSMIIEEIEAYLHPKMQLVIAQAVIRLMNSGKPVWFTTHSDLVVQHINNMMKLNNSNDKKRLMEKYGYKKEDLLKTEDVRLYQFNVENNFTTIEEIEATEYGFRTPTFNTVLDDLMNLTHDIDEGFDSVDGDF
jgi:predicted ATPase